MPPAEVPPAEVPPADVPPAEVPPAEVPPAEVPSAELVLPQYHHHQKFFAAHVLSRQFLRNLNEERYET